MDILKRPSSFQLIFVVQELYGFHKMLHQQQTKSVS